MQSTKNSGIQEIRNVYTNKNCGYGFNSSRCSLCLIIILVNVCMNKLYKEYLQYLFREKFIYTYSLCGCCKIYSSLYELNFTFCAIKCCTIHQKKNKVLQGDESHLFFLVHVAGSLSEALEQNCISTKMERMGHAVIKAEKIRRAKTSGFGFYDK